MRKNSSDKSTIVLSNIRKDPFKQNKSKIYLIKSTSFFKVSSPYPQILWILSFKNVSYILYFVSEKQRFDFNEEKSHTRPFPQPHKISS